MPTNSIVYRSYVHCVIICGIYTCNILASVNGIFCNYFIGFLFEKSNIELFLYVVNDVHASG